MNIKACVDSYFGTKHTPQLHAGGCKDARFNPVCVCALLQNVLPDILAVVQVALEGNVSKRSAVNSLARGELPQVRCM